MPDDGVAGVDGTGPPREESNCLWPSKFPENTSQATRRRCQAVRILDLLCGSPCVPYTWSIAAVEWNRQQHMLRGSGSVEWVESLPQEQRSALNRAASLFVRLAERRT